MKTYEIVQKAKNLGCSAESIRTFISGYKEIARWGIVWELHKEGYSDEEIARKLGYAKRTVQAYRSHYNCFQKGSSTNEYEELLKVYLQRAPSVFEMTCRNC
jgi:DNA-binding NarL/FixJ family response regulator